MILTIISLLFRRYWGGWFKPNPIIKRILAFLLPFCQLFFMTRNSYIALFVSIVILLAFLNNFHGEGMRMGRGGKPSLLNCILIMGGSYGAYMTIAGLIWSYFSDNYWYCLLGCFGFLTPLGYIIGWTLWERLKLKPFGEYPKNNVFIDGATSIGELWLGYCLLGSLPTIHYIVTML